MSEQSQGTWLTQEAYDRLSAELEHRKTTERKEIAQRVEAARQEGDLRENAGYHAAREEAGLNEARIIQLEETLENAQIGEAADDGSVSAGTIVTAKVAGKEQVFALGGQEITAAGGFWRGSRLMVGGAPCEMPGSMSRPSSSSRSVKRGRE